MINFFFVLDDHFVNTTLALASNSVESCRPSPCQNGGRCIRNGTHYRCHCYGQYTGKFIIFLYDTGKPFMENMNFNKLLDATNKIYIPSYTHYIAKICMYVIKNKSFRSRI